MSMEALIERKSGENDREKMDTTPEQEKTGIKNIPENESSKKAEPKRERIRAYESQYDRWQ